MDELSLSDIAAVTNGSDYGGSSWVLIILFALIFGIGGFGGNATRTGEAYATQGDIQRAIDLNSIQEGQAGIAADVQRTTYETMATVKDASYNNLSEVRDIEAAVTEGFADQKTCCCETNRNIDSVRFDMANYAASVKEAIHSDGEATRAMLQQNKIEALQSQINSLQLQNAVAGVVRYPNGSTYSAGNNPFCSCGCSNI